VTDAELLGLCRDLVTRARKSGATHAEAVAAWERALQTGLENNDVHSVESTEETVFGLRVLVGQSVGFIAANNLGPDMLARAADEAVAQARVTPADPFNGLPDPAPVTPVAGLYDSGTADAGVETTTRAAAALLERIRSADGRVRVDSGSVSVTCSAGAIVSTTGIELVQRETLAQAYAFGMAVEGEDVASFDYDGDAARSLAQLDERLPSIADRFVAKCLSGLRARKGRSFKGSIVLSPEAVTEFLLPNLLAAMSADAVRKGRSRLAGRAGARIASKGFTLIDDGTLPGQVASSAFDREGVPVRRWTLIDDGVLTTYLFNHYEARAVNARSTGHAAGSASSLPGIAPHYLEVAAGDHAAADLESGDAPLVWVGRFSGSSNAVTGEFSGVVKNGFLIEGGERRPVRETLIAGNLFDVLERIEAISRERRSIGGTRLVPSMRIGGVSVTAG
jgi:PmbA protein